jgi:hypothetical protein
MMEGPVFVPVPDRQPVAVRLGRQEGVTQGARLTIEYLDGSSPDDPVPQREGAAGSGQQVKPPFVVQDH